MSALSRTAGAGVLVVGVLGAGALSAGCGAGELRGRNRGTEEVVVRARGQGAYRCAPRELAMAESHLDFSVGELAAGNYWKASRETGVAEDNARRALALSSSAACNPVRVARVIDTDGDGIADKDDHCPTEAEDKDGFKDADGCPDPDNDQDGIADVHDRCPDEPEDKDGFQDADGCPEPDNDQDGLADADDKCPDQPGPRDNGGCPASPPAAEPPKYIVVTKEKIELKQKVHFATNKARIMPDSFAMLNEVGEVLKARPEVRVRIEGHTDTRGTLAHNMKLSQSRADAVRTYLVGQLIDPSRMEARGLGPTQPVAENRTASGREQNRRVELIITAQ